MNRTALLEDLREARSRTRRCMRVFQGERLLGPRLSIVNPPLWELGHLGWFQEKWCLRRDGSASIRRGAEALYDSALVAHDTRWSLDLPAIEATWAYLDEVLARIGDRRDESPEEAYFLRLATFHEDMHVEALVYTAQTLGYEHPCPEASTPVPAAPAEGDVDVAGGTFRLGAEREEPFVFDNEKWAHPVTLRPFRISRAAVTSGEYLEFVEDGGYGRREWWSRAGWEWKEAAGASHPAAWRREGGRWWEREFDRLRPLRLDLPVVHVNAFEAEAWCRRAGRRLPTEAEWECAAGGREKRRYPWGDRRPLPGEANLGGVHGGRIPSAALPAGEGSFGARQMMGNVWEWTASDFVPYPGFVADPYKEYSEPWFGTHRVLRGGSWITPARLVRTTWRNFYTPERRDVFAGFRTCEEDHRGTEKTERWG